MKVFWLAFLVSTSLSAAPEKVSRVSLQIGLKVDETGKEMSLTSQGTLIFEQSLGEKKKEDTSFFTSLKCEVPLKVSVGGASKPFEKAVSQRLGEIQAELKKQAGTPDTEKTTSNYFTSGFFMLTKVGAKPISGGLTSDFFETYRLQKREELKKFDPASQVAFVSGKRLGFVLPVTNDFKEKVTIKLAAAPTEGTNVFCESIKKNGFKVEAEVNTKR